jgi:NADH-quinone oxidoreductase subunit F
MNKLEDVKAFDKYKEEIISKQVTDKPWLIIGMGTCGLTRGADKITMRFRGELEQRGMADDVQIRVTGCQGFCEIEPMMVIRKDGGNQPGILYCKLKEDDVPEIIDETIKNGKIIERLLYHDETRDEIITYENELPYYKQQMRNLIATNIEIDPLNAEDYIRADGYQALKKVLTSMTPEDVIEEITKSKIRGRGGAGFPTGMKWGFARKAEGEPKYIICNADEGDPGAYMDRSVLEGNPHGIIEGMLIGAYAIGASKGYIYCREEYPMAIQHLTKAIDDLKALGLLGNNILGTKFNFDLTIYQGAGAFVCGEETALIASIEGKQGEPRQRPPFPAQKGLWGKPTNINNVETWANIPLIIRKGADWFSGIGTEGSKGTKIFSLVGKINNTGLVEVPLGINFKDIIYEIGGGIKDSKQLKAVQTGGPSGGCLPASLLEVPVDYDALQEYGAIMGSGGLIVMDEDTCMVDMAKYFLNFTMAESCGKCTSCREGAFRMREILTDISNGEASMDTLDLLKELAKYIKDTSMCGLGQTLPNPVLSTLRYFENEYYDHIVHQKCSASVCTHLFAAPCMNTCPAETNVPGYIQLIREGKFIEAYDLNKEANPFPAVCGRVCPHPCETKCKRGQYDDPIQIAALKRSAADYVFKHRDEYTQKSKLKKLDDTGKKIAIIGGGPGGLSAAFFLRRLGHSPTVFEAKKKLGGMMIQGIPPYRLPRKILEQEIKDILDMGVDVKLNTVVGKDITMENIKNDYDAIYITSGAPMDMKLGIDGEDANGVMSGLDLLREIGLGGESKIGNKVAVIGGGNSAIDAARAARRLGAEVTIVYRRMRRDMPAYEEEISGALEEGIKLMTLVGPTKVITDENNNVKGLECIKMDLGPYDRSGRCRPVPMEGSEMILDVDTIIKGIGQRADTEFIKPVCDAEINRNGTIQANRWTMETTTEGIFAGGDVHRGPDTVIRAIADGKLAAGAIDKYLMGTNRIKDIMGDYYYEMKASVGYQELRRKKIAELDPNNRQNFDEVVGEMSEEDIQYEASRCLRCDVKEVAE